MIRRIFIALFLVLMLGSVSFAFTLTPNDASVGVELREAKQIELEIKSDKESRFTISVDGWRPWMSINPTQPTLYAGETKKILLTFTPFEDTPLGLYKITVIVQDVTSGEKQISDVYISILKGEGAKIDKIIVTGNPEPFGSENIKIHIKNIGVTTLDNLFLTASITYPDGTTKDISRKIETLAPDEKTITDENISFAGDALAGEYKIKASLSGKKNYGSAEQKFTVAAKSIIEKYVKTKPTLTGKIKEIKLRNIGNAPAEDITVSDEISGFDSIFFSGDEPASKIYEINTWKIAKINQGKEITIKYEIDYISLYVFIVALILLWWAYFIKHRTLRIRKYIMQKKELLEGEEFTVGIELKNATGARLKDIEVADYVPSVFRIKEGEGPTPTKRKSNICTEMKWKIDEMGRHEERVLTYKIIPVVGVQGNLKLSLAAVRFRINGKLRENKSFHTLIGVEEESLWKELFTKNIGNAMKRKK